MEEDRMESTGIKQNDHYICDRLGKKNDSISQIKGEEKEGYWIEWNGMNAFHHIPFSFHPVLTIQIVIKVTILVSFDFNPLLLLFYHSKAA